MKFNSIMWLDYNHIRIYAPQQEGPAPFENS